MSNHSNPFAAAISAAETRAAEQAKALQEQAAARQREQVAEFGHRFLAAVVEKVVKDDLNIDRIKKVQRFCESLLMQEDQELPSIDKVREEKILDIFDYGLKLASQHGVRVADGFFYGQRVVAERQSKVTAKPERLVIPKGERPRCQPIYTTTSNVVDLKSATTPRQKKGRNKPAKVG